MKNWSKALLFITSMKAGLILLGAIGATAALGSLLSPKAFYQNIFFQLLLLLLLGNMIFCTANQLRALLRRRARGERLLQLPLRQVGLILLHGGVVLILIGGALFSLGGAREQLNIIQGDTTSISDAQAAAPLKIRLDDFQVEYYQDGTISQYYAKLSLLGDQGVTQAVTSINHPITHRGIKIYLLQYMDLLDVEGISSTGWALQEVLGDGDTFAIGGTKTTVEIIKYVPNYDPEYGPVSKTDRPDQPRVLYQVHREGQEPEKFVAPLAQWFEVEPGVTIQFKNTRPYAAFIVKSDPGLPLVAFGGLLLLVGVTLSYRRR